MKAAIALQSSYASAAVAGAGDLLPLVSESVEVVTPRNARQPLGQPAGWRGIAVSGEQTALGSAGGLELVQRYILDDVLEWILGSRQSVSVSGGLTETIHQPGAAVYATLALDRGGAVWEINGCAVRSARWRVSGGVLSLSVDFEARQADESGGSQNASSTWTWTAATRLAPVWPDLSVELGDPLAATGIVELEIAIDYELSSGATQETGLVPDAPVRIGRQVTGSFSIPRYEATTVSTLVAGNTLVGLEAVFSNGDYELGFYLPGIRLTGGPVQSGASLHRQRFEFQAEESDPPSGAGWDSALGTEMMIIARG